MNILLPNKSKDNWVDLVKQVGGEKPLTPFAPILTDFVRDLSNILLNDKSFRKYPELIAMAFWMRGAHVKELKNQFKQKSETKVWSPRGVVLHFAPSNVDSIFVYSWLISLLLGNINIIRLSQNRGEQITNLLNQVNLLINEEKYGALKQRNLIVSYPHEDEITEALSQYCSLRTIWGGDSSIKKIRSIPLPPHAIEVVFADKFSLAAIKAKPVLQLNKIQMNELAIKFFNDSYWFDQMACSSPRLVAWVGQGKEIDEAKRKFWAELSEVIQKKDIPLNPSVGVTKLVTGYSYAAQGFVNHLSCSKVGNPYRAHLAKLNYQVREQHCGGGFFLEAEIEDINSLTDSIIYKDQTLSAFGFTYQELKDFAIDLNGRGIDRIVPFGKALEFNVIWDGYDLMVYFTKETTIAI